MPYAVEIRRPAEKQITDLPRTTQARILERLASLERDPYQRGATKLAGSTSTFRVRVGDYRVIYEVDEEAGRVIVTAARHRKDVYRQR